MIEYEFFQEKQINPRQEKMARPYRNEMDFAFFAVNLHYSKAEYESLTPMEKAFIYKEWENKTVHETTLIRDAVMNAVANALRKKNARFIKLWKKNQAEVDQESAKNDIKTVEEIEKKEGKSWVDKVLYASGLRRKGVK